MLDGEIPLDNEDLPTTPEQRRQQIAVRTRFFDDFFLTATAAGIRQAVILAAGLDARAYRQAWPAGVVVFEVDQPEVIAFKSATLTQLGAEPTAERRAVGVDLRDDWPTALRDNYFDTALPTAGHPAEGLLPYLPPYDPRPAPGQHHSTQRAGQPARHGEYLRHERVHRRALSVLAQWVAQARDGHRRRRVGVARFAPSSR